MTEEESIEVYFTKGQHLGINIDTPGAAVLMVTPLEGERFSQRFVVLTDFGDNTYKLVLSWSPSRAGEERIPWGTLDGKEIDPTKHPLFGTKNEQAGLYHETLPPGCYVVREEIEV